jgi:hypothetical protein
VPPSPTSSWGGLGLGCFGGLPLLRFAGGSPDAPSSGTFLGCAITEIRRVFGKKFGRAYFRRSTPFPLLASRWGNFGRGSGCARSTLLVLAALRTTATPFRRCRCEAWERNKANREHTHRRVSSSIIAEQGKWEKGKKGGRTDPCLSSPPAEHPPRARRAVCDHQRCRRLESQTWWMGKRVGMGIVEGRGRVITNILP